MAKKDKDVDDEAGREVEPAPEMMTEVPVEPVVTVYSGDPKAGVDPASGTMLVSHDPAPAVTEAPTVIDTPFVYQVGTLLTCTMGNWNNVPTSYEYQWQTGGNVIGTNQAQYTVTPEMVGYAVTCSVTATNAGGAGIAISNEYYILDPAAPEATQAPPAA